MRSACRARSVAMPSQSAKHWIRRLFNGGGRLVATIALLIVSARTAMASDGIDGAGLGLFWSLPFIGILLSIALGPLVFNHVWEHHYGKVVTVWALLTTIPLALILGPQMAFVAVLHTVLLEYVPFILLLLALFTCAGGILIKGNLHGSPATNTMLLAVGAGLASIIGTTGASMVLIRPVLRANDGRRHNVHVVIFFIFLVSNIGGALTPLGDPPLFLGFLKGIDFFWTTTHLFSETLFMAGALIAIFFVLDTILYRREKLEPPLNDPTPTARLGLEGHVNLILIGIIIAAILMSATWKPGIAISVPGARLELQNLLRDAIMLAVTLSSLAVTNPGIRARNGFNWVPIQEVAILFIGIFTCMIPVIAMLRAGADGVFAPLVALVTGTEGEPVEAAYFWLAGGLSSFLDNAPTYLVFFELAGGNAETLMGPMASVLTAISTGAVFMGGNSYIGNAPNFMVYAIARHEGVNMPSFFGYMLWSCGILVPLFVVMTVLFFV